MPLYTVTTQDGFLSAEQRDVIAAEFVASILGVIRAGHTSEERCGSFRLSGKCSRTKKEYPIAISPSRSRKCLPARRWKMERLCRTSGTRNDDSRRCGLWRP